LALVYGLLTKVQVLGNNTGINLVLSLSIAVMALQFNFVSVFFSEIFPRLGVGLSIILVIMILLGAFIDFDQNAWIKWVFFGVGALIALIIIFQSLGSSFAFGGFIGFSNFGYFMQRWGTGLIVAIVTIVLIVMIVKKGKNNNP
jgi:hypothetical protein